MGTTGGTPQLWMPFAITDADRGENSFAAIGKLKSGVSPDQARAKVTAILDRLTRQVPNASKIEADVVSLHSQITGASRELIVLTRHDAEDLVRQVASVDPLSFHERAAKHLVHVGGDLFGTARARFAPCEVDDVRKDAGMHEHLTVGEVGRLHE
jgi:hypothetical protein